MTLLEFLKTLKTDKIKAVVMKDGEQICTIFTHGVDALDEAYKEQKVAEWELVDRFTIRAVLDGTPSA